ncbi:MAG: alpha,4-glucan--maltose-phosphate maltosyltransferase [Betaproteobacteria bacterium]|nr:alpha,4-glucan--maltose-phosphate maltosyltransferase [Betaproteobacteria bacterium]
MRAPRKATRRSLKALGIDTRLAIENVTPIVDAGRFPIKRVSGDTISVEADCFADGHDVIVCMLQYRHENETSWAETRMAALGNDRWGAQFSVDRLGAWHYGVMAWIDPLLSWQHEFARREDAEDIALAAQTGAELVAAAAQRATEDEARGRLEAWAKALRESPLEQLQETGLDDDLMDLATRYAERSGGARTSLDLRVIVEPELARCSAWYELFPRSAADEPGRHGTFDDVIKRLPYVAGMGFDILYVPPIHPIGRERRKGRNNAVSAESDDVGSPWAIGSSDGGHTSIHAELGTLEDFRRLVEAAREYHISIALDIAFQAAPDHPYVKAHPEWFTWRPDGTVQYAENPPKKYQDIYPLNFQSDDWPALWEELRRVFVFWIEQGVRVFRVDNPHTKPFRFWEWVIAEIKRAHPEVIFLSEAFTRPRIMHRLAKVGFSQSYTYFTWRNTKTELIEYFTELSQSPSREYFRPNCWPNTPDILPASLRNAGPPAFALRLLLAATLAANYGIYGAAFELMENAPRDNVSEEYLYAEKYELRHWNLERPDSLAGFIARVNAIRRGNPALHSDWTLHFHPVDNDQLICYSKTAAGNTILVVANLDVRWAQSGWITLDLAALGLAGDTAYEAHDLLDDRRYRWQGARNFVRLDPAAAPAHVLRLAAAAPPAPALNAGRL